MKQVTHTQRDGAILIQDVPPPMLRSGGLLVRTACSVISAGTERTKVEVAKKGLLGKALARPDQVRQVIESAQQIGVAATYQKISSRMDALIPLGYSSAGVVIRAGADTRGFAPGDRVACGGATATHSEIVYVPQNLCARVPDGVGLDEAAFATVGSIALHGVRQSEATLGETVGVIGLGLLGLMTVQLLRSAGCRVVGIDIDDARCELARRFSADAVFSPDSPDAERMTRRVSTAGLDAVIVTAATSSNEPVVLAGRLARDRAIVVVVGAVGIDVPRSPYYEKELEVRLSRSYGPGRYDSQYEEKGTDYPIGYVRWTEGRNMMAILDLIAQRKLDVRSLITHRFSLADATAAYDLLGRRSVPFLGIVLDHGVPEPSTTAISAASGPIHVRPDRNGAGKIGIGLIGAGNFAQAMLLPHLHRHADVRLRAVMTPGGLTARSVADRVGFEVCAGEPETVLADPDVRLVLIASRHDSHAALAAAALRAGKAVFVEKPLALTPHQQEEVVAAYHQAGRRAAEELGHVSPFLMVGFNRRFQPLVRSLREFMHEGGEPMLVHYRVNAGYIPRDHWTQDRETGGGRIVGEVCHFVDLILHLVNQPPREVYAHALPDAGRYSRDNLSVLIHFSDGSTATITYAANGDRGIEKERIEVFGGGRCGVLEDFRKLTLAAGGKTQVRKSGPDKGHRAEMTALVDAMTRGLPAPIPFQEAVRSMNVTFAIEEALAAGQPVTLGPGRGTV